MQKNVDIGIVVALNEECAATCEIFGAKLTERPTREDPNFYYEATVPAPQGAYRVVIVKSSKMGNTGAGLVANDLIRKYSVRHVIMVGIAAGIPNPDDPAKHVRLGDVVVSYGKGVIQYDMLKRNADGAPEVRSNLPPPSKILQGAVDLLKQEELRKRRTWTAHIERAGEMGVRPPEETDILEMPTSGQKIRWRRVPHPPLDPSVPPRVHLGTIGSGNCLLKNVAERDRLAAELGIIAVEMEGAGIADAVWNQTDVGDYLIVRGICDYADRRKNDLWHNYAAAGAAAYTRALIETAPFPPKERQEGHARTTQLVFNPELQRALEDYFGWVSRSQSSLMFRGRTGKQEVPVLDALAPLSLTLQQSNRTQKARPEVPALRAMGVMALWPQGEAVSLSPKRPGAETVPVKNLLRRNANLIILGPAGAGKTTILQYVAYVTATALQMEVGKADEHLGVTGDVPVPVYISLNAFAHFLFDENNGNQGKTMWDFAVQYLRQRHAGISLPADFFQQLLKARRAMILLLDGLDEVVDPDQRQIVIQAVEDITRGTSEIRTIVTCRQPVYLGSLVLPVPFEVFDMQPLSPEEVAHYVAKVCTLLLAPDAQEARRQADVIGKALAAIEQRRETMGLTASRLFDTILIVRLAISVHMMSEEMGPRRARLIQMYIEAILRSDYSSDRTVGVRLRKAGGEISVQMRILGAIAFELHRGVEGGLRQDEALIAIINESLAGLELAGDAAFGRSWVNLVRQRGGILEFRNGKYQIAHLVFQELLAGDIVARYLNEDNRSASRLLGEEFFFAVHWREPLVNCVESCIDLDCLPKLWAVLRVLVPTRLVAKRPGVVNCVIGITRGLFDYEVPGSTREELSRWIKEALFSDYAEMETATDRAELGRLVAAMGDPRLEVATELPNLIVAAAGAFEMGDPEGAVIDLPGVEPGRYLVTLGAFGLGRFPITNRQFAAFVSAGGYTMQRQECWTRAGWKWRTANRIVAPAYWTETRWALSNHPVVGVSWFEAVAYTAWLSRQHGRRFRLPTEAEWERMAGGRGRWPWGDAKETRVLANTEEARIGRTSCVGLFPKGDSAVGVSDISGNVWEWTNSGFRNYGHYDGGDGREALEESLPRVIRGGSWLNSLDRARVTNRDHYPPEDRHHDLGFRIAETI